MDFITVFDTDIFFVNRGKKENEDSSIIYKDKVGNLREINFYTCALNYKKERAQSSNDCIGERNITEYCFIFYTSGIKTKIAFKKRYVLDLFNRRLLKGNRISRFHALQKMINETNFKTYDLS